MMQLKQDFLSCTSLLTTDDFNHYVSNNMVFASLGDVEVNNQNFILAITEEKAYRALDVANKYKNEYKPEMADIVMPQVDSGMLNMLGNIILQFLKYATNNNEYDAINVLEECFEDDKAVLDYYDVGYILSEDNEEEQEDEEEVVEDFAVLADDEEDLAIIAELKEKLLEDVHPNITSFTADFESVEKADNTMFVGAVSEVFLNTVMSYEKLIEDASQELDEARQEIAECREEVSNLNSDIQGLVGKLSEYENLVKSIEENTLEEEDIQDCLEYLNDCDSEEIKALLIKFISDKSKSNDTKSPFILSMFDYLMEG